MTYEPSPIPIPTPAPTHADALAELASCAETAIRHLAHLSRDPGDLSPADIDTVLGHLAETVATLPQVATQLSHALDRTRASHDLSMDGMTQTTYPDLAIDTARLHLDTLPAPAVETYWHLTAARNQVAHIAATPINADINTGIEAESLLRRPDHQPPPPFTGPRFSGPSR